MKRFILNKLNTPKTLRQALVLITLLLLPTTAWGQAGTYGISIAGTALTSENYNPTTGAVNNMEGVTFDFQNSILTLENVTIESDSPAIESSLESLTINIIGNNNLSSSSSNAIQSDKANATLRISRDGSSSTLMLVPSSSSYAITGFNTSLDGVNAYSTDTYSSISSTNGNLGDNGKAVLICSGTPYGFYVGGTIVTSENKGTVLGSGVDFIPGNESTATLKLSNNATIPGDIEWDLTKDLTIEVYAGNTIQGCIYTFRNTPKLYFTYPSGSTDSNITIGNSEGDNSAIEGFSGIIFPEDNKLKFDENLIYVEQSLRDNENNQKSKLAHISYHYGLSIYKGNNILMDFSTNKSSFSSNDGIDGFSSGSISFDNSERKLTLTGVTIADGIILWDHIGDSETLKIDLSGNSTITCETPMTITQEGGPQVTTQIKAPIISRAEVNYWTVYPTPSERANQPYIQFTSADQNERSLILSKKDVDNCIQGFKYIDNSVVDGSVTHTKTTDNIDGGHAYMLITSESYMSLNNILVHGIEDFPTGYKANVTGETNQENEPLISYDSEENTLTLNGVNLTTTSDFIFSNLSDLKINLVGDNTISVANGYVAFKGNKTNAKVTFNTSTTNPGNLAITVPEANLFSSITDSYQEGLSHTYKDGVYTISATSYGLTVAGVEVTSLNCEDILDGENKGKVSFTPATISLDSQTPSTPATLTLNDAVLTAPIIIGLSELTIDIQGTNSITTEEKCIQKMENTTPAVTFTSTSDVVGSLTLKGAAGVNNLGVDDKGSFTITDKLALVLKKGGDVYSNQYYFMDEHTTEAILSPSYGVTVGGMQICQDNAADVIGEGIGNGKQGGMVKFTPAASDTPATLTLNGATISGTIKSSLNDLIIKIAGSSNTLTAILYEGSSTSSTLLIKTPSSSSTVNKLTLQNSTGAVISGFSTVTLDGLFFSTPNYPSVTTSTDWTSSIYEAIITNEYGITIGGVDVTTTNKDDVLNDEGTVKFTPADNTATPATPATLTLNGAKITGTVFWTNSAPLTIAINGTNSVTTTDAYAIKGNNQDNTTLTIAKVSETGKCKLILSGSSVGSISGFKNSSDTYAGSGLVYYEDQEEYTATILSTLSGSGTSTDPYLIETPEDLKDFSFFVNKQIITNKYIKIANNIDCKDLEGFESIGSSYPFMGTLSGYGNTISNLTINSGLGFFGHISGGIVNDLNFYKLSVKGNSYATGGIASELSAGGQIDNCTLTECTIACLDNQYSPEVGGIVARLSDSGSKISNCVVYNSTINASTIYTGGSGPIGYAGGIVASYSSGTITNCHVKDGSKIINVNADGGSTLKTGALVGNVSSDATTSITSNFYYYDVTVETQLGNSAKETKSGYTPRGTSDNTEDPTGAMLYTKNVIIPISTDAGHVSINSDYYYKVTSDDTNTTYSIAPDVETVISVENATVEGSFTLDSETKTIELKPKEGSTGLYTFDMPNADVTFTVQEAAAVSFSEEGQIYASYYNATKDVAVPLGMTAYIVTGVSEDGTKVIVSPVSYIKKGVAVLIEKDKTTEVSETTDFSGSKLIYAENDVPVTTGSKLYVLYQNQFVKATAGSPIPTGKNYLDLSTSTNAGTRGFYDIGGANDGTSALRGVTAEGTNGKSDAWYTLQGRRLSAKPTKSGLYLHNGAKVVVK